MIVLQGRMMTTSQQLLCVPIRSLFSSRYAKKLPLATATKVEQSAAQRVAPACHRRYRYGVIPLRCLTKDGAKTEGMLALFAVIHQDSIMLTPMPFVPQRRRSTAPTYSSIPGGRQAKMYNQRLRGLLLKRLFRTAVLVSCFLLVHQMKHQSMSIDCV